jgi:hypothetical protein
VMPSSTEVINALNDLAKQTGRETFQSVRIAAGWWLTVELLTADGGMQEYSYRDTSWTTGTRHDRTLLSPPASVTIGELPLDHLAAYADAARGADSVTLEVDYVGRLRVLAFVDSELVGLTPDGSGSVPDLSPDDVDDVRAAIAEMVTGYGTSVTKVGSFNDLVYMDANVAGCDVGVRVVRNPRIAASADILQGSLLEQRLLFDPTGFDPAMAVTRKSTIGKEAGVEGTVWDWTYSRPPQGGDPLVSFGIGTDGPSTQVWLDESGKVAAVLGEKCKSDAGWCPP